jgi:hypothetical protein
MERRNAVAVKKVESDMKNRRSFIQLVAAVRGKLWHRNSLFIFFSSINNYVH